MKACWIVGIVMAAGLRAQDCSVNVYVETDLNLPFGMLPDAKTKVIQMFREIGVTVQMRNGIPAHDPSGSCGAPIVVNLENSGDYRGNSDALAYTVPYRKSGACIHVFIGRVLRHLNHEPAFSNAVMAHEITHALEQIDRHSAEGVMKAAWSEDDFHSMKRHPLPFAQADVDLIHTGLAKRI